MKLWLAGKLLKLSFYLMGDDDTRECVADLLGRAADQGLIRKTFGNGV